MFKAYDINAGTNPNLWKEMTKIFDDCAVTFDFIKGIPKNPPHPRMFESSILVEYRKDTIGLFLGDRAMNKLGYFNEKDAVPEELKAVFYHECAHIKHNDLAKKKFTRISPWAGAAIAMTAVALHERWQKKKTKKKLEAKQAELSETEKELIEVAQKAPEARSVLKSILRTAKYVAAGLAGATAGFVVNSYINHHMEYAADKFAAEKMGTAQPMINALEKLKELRKEAVSERHPHLTEEQVSKVIDLSDKLTHAPMQNRIDRLSQMSFGKNR